MEARRGHSMVTNLLPKTTSVPLLDVLKAGNRFEASVFSIDAKNAKALIQSLNLEKAPLFGKGGLVDAYHCPRFKRPYVDRSGTPFFQPSQITETLPKPARYLSKSAGDFEHLKVHKGQILLTCSGTIGKLGLVTDHLNKAVFSHDMIRLTPKSNTMMGYIYTFLNSDVGQLLLTTSNYGAVIQHIEPEHLEEIEIPLPEDKVIQEIGEFTQHYLQALNRSNSLILEARSLLLEQLNLTTLEQLEQVGFRASSNLQNISLNFKDLQARFDASFHSPEAESIEKHFKLNKIKTLKLGDEKLSKEIFLPGRFKRVYVEGRYGVHFIGGKEIGNLDPRTGKKLSLQGHGDRISNELLIKNNMLLVTRSGTIGKVTLAPSHWESWAASEHIIRVIPQDDLMAGYIYTWLSTEFGLEMVKRHTYGSVVDEIDDYHVREITVPMLSEALISKIGALVVEANQLKAQAFEFERLAQKSLLEKVLKIK